MKKLIVFFILLMGHSYYIMAQHNTVTGVLTKCMNYYSSHPQLSFDMYYKMYDSHTSSKLIHQLNGTMKVNHGNTFMQMGGQTQMVNSSFAIITDDLTKTMVVQERKNEKSNHRTPLGIDSLIGLFGETTVLKETDQIVTLSFNKPKAAFYTVNYFTVDIEKETGKVLAAVLFYAFDIHDFYTEYDKKTIPRIEILYENYSELNNNNNDFFSEERFFKVKDKTIEPVKNFSDYRLIDLRNTSYKKTNK